HAGHKIHYCFSRVYCTLKETPRAVNPTTTEQNPRTTNFVCVCCNERNNGEATSCDNFYSTYNNDRSRTKAYNNDKLWTSASLFRLRNKNICN
ncbi:hypothetical protein BGZ59_009949, partial [Podila verticillata]